jgi:hypothetical protein
MLALAGYVISPKLKESLTQIQKYKLFSFKSFSFFTEIFSNSQIFSERPLKWHFKKIF